ncbi:MAG: CDP-alcohol phosphatidyltransferase family protein [Clostridiales bacterium]|nr:CDP-alcohol phosphatidyltransferase family protein [Clostridiales bacterium]
MDYTCNVPEFFLKETHLMKNRQVLFRDTKPASKIFTIPNILSMVRLAMIPVIVWAYFAFESKVLAAVLLLLSGLTDIVDGYIARHYNMISDLGKALDPVADKLTQASMMCCLAVDHPGVRLPLVLLVIKEIPSALAALGAIHKSGKVEGAQWHGKVTTVLIHTMMILHLLWEEMPDWASNVLIAACVGMMLYSFVRYLTRSVKTMREESK